MVVVHVRRRLGPGPEEPVGGDVLGCAGNDVGGHHGERADVGPLGVGGVGQPPVLLHPDDQAIGGVAPGRRREPRAVEVVCV